MLNKNKEINTQLNWIFRFNDSVWTCLQAKALADYIAIEIFFRTKKITNLEANREESGDSPSIGKAGTACRIEGTRHSLDPTWEESGDSLLFGT